MNTPDIFGATVAAIKELAPTLRYTLSGATDEDGTPLNEVDWDSFVLDEGETAPTKEEIIAKRTELIESAPMRVLRRQRDAKIAETDWWVLPDRNPTEEQLAYRQALRDITLNYTSVDDVVWPVKP